MHHGNVDFSGSGAIISDCGAYRYRLDRHVGAGDAVYAFFGVNPSTADHMQDDATVRKWIGFSKRLGVGRFVVGNAFALRATDVRELGKHPDPVGPEWRKHTADIIREADVLVPCWGARGKIPKRLREKFWVLKGMIADSGKPVKCWGLTASSDPVHPLMLAYNTLLVDLVDGLDW